MSNYTTQTAALKAVTIDTAKLDAKQIDTKKLFINGELFDPSQTGSSQIKESPNEAKFQFIIVPIEDRSYVGMFAMLSVKEEQQYFFDDTLQKAFGTEGYIENGIYAVVPINDNFAKCIGGNSLNDADTMWINNIPLAKFEILNIISTKVEQCILENFIIIDSEDGNYYWFIKICEKDDNLSELYGGVTGGITEDYPNFTFLVSIPYYIPENDTSSSTYSLRKTNHIDSLREKFEEMRQQILDKSAE